MDRKGVDVTEHRASDTFVVVEVFDRYREETNTRLDSIIREQQTLNNRLYRDNGHKSIQSILNDHDRILRIMVWIACAAGVATIGNVALVAKEIVAKHFGG